MVLVATALAFSGILCITGLVLWGVEVAREVYWFGLTVGPGTLAFAVVPAMHLSPKLRYIASGYGFPFKVLQTNVTDAP
jgi:hypothetical protein